MERIFIGIMRALGELSGGGIYVASARNGREIIDLAKQLVGRESLEHAQVEGGAANSTP